jgi:hypothetical protein
MGTPDRKFEQFTSWAFQAILSACCLFVVHEIGLIRNSVETLNERIAVVVEKQIWHEKELSSQNDRITRLEQKGR